MYQMSRAGLEVYVRPFPGNASSPNEKWQLSLTWWRIATLVEARIRTFFAKADQIMVTQYAVRGGSFLAGKPRLWSPTRIFGSTGFSDPDLAPDGKRFIVFSRPEPAGRVEAPRVTLLLNFFDELRRHSPND
jgi:hypothetical protein